MSTHEYDSWNFTKMGLDLDATYKMETGRDQDSGLKALYSAVIEQAVKDMRNTKKGSQVFQEALEYVFSSDCLAQCAFIGVDYRYLTEKLARELNIGGVNWEVLYNTVE